MDRLRLNREQVIKLVNCGLLPAPHRHGLTRLLDPAALAALEARRVLVDVGRPDSSDPTAAGAVPYALALHLGPRAPDPDPQRNQRAWIGWKADGATPDDAWTGWWACGSDLASQVVAAGLPLLPAVSGYVVDERDVRGFRMHPVTGGLVQFDVLPPRPVTERQFTDTVFRAAPGSPYQLLWRPIAAAVGSGPSMSATRADQGDCDD
jgi:hypothetical protein